VLSGFGGAALVAVGKEDAITGPDKAKAMAGVLRHARLVEIAGAGHLGPITHAPRVNAAILAHLARHLSHDKLALAA
jgi:pimeloyl-ACP methyl ester carboxylesterase